MHNRNRHPSFFSHPLFIGIWFVITVIVGVIITRLSANLAEISGGLSILDTRFSYTSSDAYTLFERLGSEGRRLYQIMHTSLDVIFPVAYSLFLASAAIWLCKLLGIKKPLKGIVTIAMCLGGLTDLLENLLITVLVHQFPKQLPALVSTSQAFTQIKFILIGLAFLLLLVLAGIYLSRKMRRKDTLA
jgi:hypothetical protein